MTDPRPSDSPCDMRAEFQAWVKDCGCDTDGAWSAWQAAWNRRAALPVPSDERLTDEQIVQIEDAVAYSRAPVRFIAFARAIEAAILAAASEPADRKVMEQAIRMRDALDAIYNHNEAARAAVVMHYGTCHAPAIAALRTRLSGEKP